MSESDGTTTALATPAERDANVIQFDKMREVTVEKGLLRLPVSTVTKAENSETWALEVEHPIEGSHRVYVPAPTEGMVPGSELYELLAWYDCSEPYELRFQRVYVEKDEDCGYAHGWDLTAPPDYTPSPPRPMREQLHGLYDSVIGLPRPRATMEAFYAFLFIAVVVAAAIPGTDGMWLQAAANLLAFLFATVVAMILLKPPEDR